MRVKMVMSALLLLALGLVATGCTSIYAGTQPGTQSGTGGNAPMIPYHTPTPGSPTGQPPVSSTGSAIQSHPMIPYTGTAVPSTGSVISNGLSAANGNATATGSTTPLVPDSSGNLTITPGDSGRTVLLQTNQRFVLKLGDNYNWTVTIPNQDVVSRVVNIMPVLGSQGVFEAHKAGTTTLQAAGDPTCRQSQPPCALASVNFTITITVK